MLGRVRHLYDGRDDLTRSTRAAANAGALAVAGYGVLYLVTTQVRFVRSASPFGDDPWDVVVSYGAIFLAIVVSATAIRSLRHRGPRLEPAIAARVRRGVAMALVTIGVTLASDLSALLLAPLPDPAARTDGRLAFIVGLLAVSGFTAILATVFLRRAALIAARSAERDGSDRGTEPDVLDDLLGLAGDVAGSVPRLRPAVRRVVDTVSGFLDRSKLSPRRHPIAFGFAVAVVAGMAYAVWHAIVEGPWASPFVVVLFATLVGAGVLAVYAATLRPLRLLRPPG
jgi:hypothetical protein